MEAAMDGDLNSLCRKPSFIFEKFDNFVACSNDLTTNQTFEHLVQTCVRDYCKNPDTELGGCQGLDAYQYPYGFMIRNDNDSYTFYSGPACGGISSNVNADIGGPGAVISYFFQLVIILYLWFLLRTFSFTSRMFRFAGHLASRLKQDQARKNAETLEHRSREYLATHAYVLKSILVEYQEAQCWFMIACQAATMFAMKYNQVFDASTLMSLLANNSVANVVAAAGILPIVFGLWSLLKMHMCSTWIFFLSTVTLIMAEVAFIRNATKWPKINRLAALDGDWPSSCGGQPPPIRWCANPDFMHHLTIPQKLFGYALDPFCFVVYVFCLVEWLVLRLRKWIRFGSIVKKPPPLTRLSCAFQRFRASKWFIYGHGFFSAAVEVLLLVASIVYVAMFVLIAEAGTVDLSGWSFGQILAITLWAPVIGKYVYWSIFGTESYSEVRVAAPYRIVKIGEDEDDDEHKKEYDHDHDRPSRVLPLSSGPHLLDKKQDYYSQESQLCLDA